MRAFSLRAEFEFKFVMYGQSNYIAESDRRRRPINIHYVPKHTHTNTSTYMYIYTGLLTNNRRSYCKGGGGYTTPCTYIGICIHVQTGRGDIFVIRWVWYTGKNAWEEQENLNYSSHNETCTLLIVTCNASLQSGKGYEDMILKSTA